MYILCLVIYLGYTTLNMLVDLFYSQKRLNNALIGLFPCFSVRISLIDYFVIHMCPFAYILFCLIYKLATYGSHNF